LLTRVVEGIGYVVRVAIDSDEFKSAHRAFDPDVIVMETVMPDTDGLEIIDWLGSQASRSHIVIVTGFNPIYAEIAKHRAAETGTLSIDVLTKPVGDRELVAALAGVVQ